MTTIAITTFKGGVGKTTTARDLSAALAKHGHTVLALDLDRTQRHLMKFEDGLSGIDCKAVTAGRLKSIVERNQQKPLYQFIVIDCPPALEKQTAAALSVADLVIAPVQAEYLAADGLGNLMEAVAIARDPRRGGSNPQLKVKALITMFDNRDPVCAIIEKNIRARFRDIVFAQTIKRQPQFSLAALAGQSIIEHSPRAQGALVYKALAQDIIQGITQEVQHGR